MEVFFMNKHHFTPSEILRRHEPKDLQMTYTSARRLNIKDSTVILSGQEEMCLFCLKGTAEYTFNDVCGEVSAKDMLYIPIDSKITLDGDAVIMQFGAPCSRKTDFAYIKFSDVDKSERHKVYGKKEDGTLRDVWNYIDDNFNSSRFLVGMCKGEKGGWTA